MLSGINNWVPFDNIAMIGWSLPCLAVVAPSQGAVPIRTRRSPRPLTSDFVHALAVTTLT